MIFVYSFANVERESAALEPLKARSGDGDRVRSERERPIGNPARKHLGSIRFSTGSCQLAKVLVDHIQCCVERRGLLLGSGGCGFFQLLV